MLTVCCLSNALSVSYTQYNGSESYCELEVKTHKIYCKIRRLRICFLEVWKQMQILVHSFLGISLALGFSRPCFPNSFLTHKQIGDELAGDGLIGFWCLKLPFHLLGYGVTANIAASHKNPIIRLLIAAARGSIPRTRICWGKYNFL